MAVAAAGTRASVWAPVMGGAVFRARLLFGDRVEGFLREFGVLRHRQSRFDKSFYAADLESLIRRRDSYGVAFMSCPAGAADPMDIIFRVLRQVIVYHELYPHDIYSARRYIGGDEYPVFAGFETFKRFSALGQRLVRMYFSGAPAGIS